MYNLTCAVSHETIEKMEEGGVSQADIDYARETMWSMDQRDVVNHRTFIKDYNPGDPWKQPNHFVMHPRNYRFGEGETSPEYIGNMLSQLPEPVQLSGPQFQFPENVRPHIEPYVVFRPFQKQPEYSQPSAASQSSYTASRSSNQSGNSQPQLGVVYRHFQKQPECSQPSTESQSSYSTSRSSNQSGNSQPQLGVVYRHFQNR